MLDINLNRKRSVIWKLERNEFINVVKEKNTLTEILSHFGLKMHGANNKTLNERIKFENIDISHIEEYRKKKNLEHLKNIHNRNLRPLDEILVKNSDYLKTHHLKNRLLKEKLLRNQCYECNISGFWNGKPLSLHLDHIDGDRTNNLLSNLRLLCPNCHSQTDTYCGKAKRKYYQCMDCGGNRSRDSRSKLCISCFNNSKINKKTKVKDKITKEELTKLILEKPFLQIGKDYGVSDNAIRKWCKSYDLPHRKKDIEQQREHLEASLDKELILI